MDIVQLASRLDYYSQVALRSYLNQELRGKSPPATTCVSCEALFNPSKQQPFHRKCPDCTESQRRQDARAISTRWRQKPENKQRYREWWIVNYK
jgi:predicted RNA-binding Zn-ribbon protein involved in translation (DUF1610 family)